MSDQPGASAPDLDESADPFVGAVTPGISGSAVSSTWAWLAFGILLWGRRVVPL